MRPVGAAHMQDMSGCAFGRLLCTWLLIQHVKCLFMQAFIIAVRR
jgi:hypothetical protein